MEGRLVIHDIGYCLFRYKGELNRFLIKKLLIFLFREVWRLYLHLLELFHIDVSKPRMFQNLECTTLASKSLLWLLFEHLRNQITTVVGDILHEYRTLSLRNLHFFLLNVLVQLMSITIEEGGLSEQHLVD